jgi:hypothetical protein
MAYSEISTVHYQMIHNIFGKFIAGLAHHLKKELIPRAEDAMISTYEKAIEHYRNRKRLGGEKWSPKFPFLIIDPQMDFEPDAQSGRYLHGYPNFMQRFAMNLYKPDIYKDNNIQITPVLNRYRGVIDIHLYCSSIYELIDEKVHLHQFFGDYNRPIYPFIFESFITIPDSIKNFEYKNPYTGEDYMIDWDSPDNRSEIFLLKAPAREELCFPIHIRPWIKLSSISSSEDKFGGSGDIIGDHRLIISIEWEASIPTHVVMEANYFPIPRIPIEFKVPIDFKNVTEPMTRESISIPYRFHSVAHLGLDSSGNHPPGQPEKIDLIFDEIVSYILTQDDLDILTNNDILEIDIGREIRDERYLKVKTPIGWLDRDIAWRVKEEDKTKIEILGVLTKSILNVDDLVAIFIYKEEPVTDE